MIRILHVDDSQEDLEFADILLHQLFDDIDVARAESSSQAIDQLKKDKYDCILCEYQTSNIDGLKLLKTLRSDGVSIPLIFYSRKDRQDNALVAMRAGACEYIPKRKSPTQYKRLQNIIQKISDAQKEEPGGRMGFITPLEISDGGRFFTDKPSAAVEKRADVQEGVRIPVEFLSDAVVVVKENGKIVFMNHAARGFFGYEASEDYDNRPVSDLFDSTDRVEVAGIIRSLLEEGCAVKASRIRWRCRDGSFVTAEADWLPLVYQGEQAFVAVLHEIKARREVSEDARSVFLAILEKIINCLDDAVFVVDPGNGKIITCNKSVERIFGYCAIELQGNDSDVLHVSKGMCDIFNRAAATAVLSEGVFHAEYQMRRKDGSTFFTKQSVAEIVDLSEHRIGLVNVVRVVTEGVGVNGDLGDLRDKFKNRLRELLVASEKLETVSESVSHGPGAPVGRISDAGGDLKADNGARRERIEQISKSCRRTVQLIDELLKQLSLTGK